MLTTRDRWMARFRGADPRSTLAIGLAATVVACALVAVANPTVPHDDPSSAAWWRSIVALAAVMLVIGIALARRARPGMAYPLLAFAAASVASPVEQAWWTSRSLALSGDTATATPAFGLILLAALARTAVPAAILGLYAAAPERRLGRWVSPVVGLVALAMFLTAIARVRFEMEIWPSDLPYWDAGQLDQPMPIFVIAAIGLLGSLRSAARQQRSVASPERVFEGPQRAVVAAVIAILSIWPVAMYAFLNRSYVADWSEEGISRLVFLPLLLALVGFVAARWSQLAAWAALACAFQADAILIFYWGLSDYVTAVLANGPDVFTPPPVTFLVSTAAGVAIQMLAFSAMSIALLDAWRDGRDGDPARRSWAVRGALAGLAFCAWYLGGAVASGNAPYANEVLLAPAYPFLALVLGMGVWRRLVPAVGEAESTAVRPFRPLRYLETVVSETFQGRAAHRRGAIEAERARLASELHAEFLPNLERLAATNAAGASREDVSERIQELQDEVRRLMSERRLVILEEFGIVEALEWLVAQAEDRVAFSVDLTVDDRSTSERPPRDVERAAFRISQLAVENAIQHASPTRLALQVLARHDRLTVSVTDDGRWVPAAKDDRRRDHVGIADMRSEAGHVRGAVEVVASQSGGTTVQFAWPALGAAG